MINSVHNQGRVLVFECAYCLNHVGVYLINMTLTLAFCCVLVFFFLKNRKQVIEIGKTFGLYSFIMRGPAYTGNNKKVLGLALSLP